MQKIILFLADLIKMLIVYLPGGVLIWEFPRLFLLSKCEN